MDFYQMEECEVLNDLKSHREGLSNEEVIMFKKTYGNNCFMAPKKTSVIRIFFQQFKDLLVIILLLSSFFSFLTDDYLSGLVIFVVININALIGTILYSKTTKTLNALKKIAGNEVLVLRNKIEERIKESEIVVGDIELFSYGDIIAGDGRIIEGNDILVDESHLTGESEGVYKKEGTLYGKYSLSQQTNMLFAGSKVLKGKGKMVVTKIGMKTEIGQIAQILENTKETMTPLEKALKDLNTKLAFLILFICAFVYVINVFQGKNIYQSAMFSMALAVAAIPEAMSTIVVICLAIGVVKMAANHALVKNMKKVEALGAVSLICSDKTGTITKNEMKVHRLFYPNDFMKNILHDALIIANEVKPDHFSISPTDYALYEYAKEKASLSLKSSIILETPFDSEHKQMAVILDYKGRKTTFKKGAYEYLKKEIIYYDNQIISSINFCQIEEEIRVMSKEGLRVLCFTYGEQEQHFLGLVGIMDAPREGIETTIMDCYKSHIKVAMITGDSKETAQAIARKVGIKADKVLENIHELSFQQLRLAVKDTYVFPRATPKDKLRIIEAYKANGEMVAMTGDGINDAPALKKADIGIAMGNGMEVSKEASDIVLLDNDFSTIYKAVINGRNIYANIRNVVCFLVAGNMAGILIALFATILSRPFPFLPVHLLFMNLLTDSLPAIALGLNENNEQCKRDYPRKSKEKIINKKLGFKIVLEGILLSIVSIIAYYQAIKTNHYSMCFLVLCLSRLFFGFSFRHPLRNKWLIAAVFVGFLLMNLAMFIPNLRVLFSLDCFSPKEIFYIYLLALTPTIIIQLYYYLSDRRKREVRSL